MQILLSLPSSLVDHFAELEDKPLPEWVPVADPPGAFLGSGGGTANVLVQAWKKTAADTSFRQWLRASKRLMIHAGGQSRRLPAYAATSKLLLPIPVFRWAKGQRLDQSLLDLQLPLYRRVLSSAPRSTVAMVTCGDVLLRSRGPLPPLPDVDVLCLGLWVPPEAATGHGVFFCPRSHPERLQFFLQKPTSEQIRELSLEHLFLIDTGVWLLSENAVRVLMARSGWSWDHEQFDSHVPGHYELYAQFGLSLGESPTAVDSEIGRLSSAVVPLGGGEFYHFGTSGDLTRSCLRLQNLVLDQREFGAPMSKPHPEMFVQNADIRLPLHEGNRALWVENSTIGADWKLACEHVFTGIPDNTWSLEVPEGTCLDVVPVGETNHCIRVYGITDAFRGAIGDEGTAFCGRSAVDWFVQREIQFGDAGIDPHADIQDAPLFPILEQPQMDESFVQWLLDAKATGSSERNRRVWLDAPRLSAAELIDRANLHRIYRKRREHRGRNLLALANNSARSVFYNLDLAHTAQSYAATGHPLPPDEPAESPLMRHVHQHMFAAAVLRHRGQAESESHERQAFRLLREAMIQNTQNRPVRPLRQLLDDQIIWGRSPARLDLAGGWTDTPPYCLSNGGKVVNIAVDLNGQPPIQAFAKIAEAPHIVLRSIDLGVEQRITTYDELRDYSEVGSSFSIAKAALALAGFLPEFCTEPAPKSLKQQLGEFGGGIEISLLAAIPKGSGLGTSSILAATLLGTLGELGGLNWDHAEICKRTLALEQMLTTGGGWQDQVGGITRGLKLTETHPGLDQEPLIRWLPPHLFTDSATKSCMLLYYTGITRVAKNILAEIVRGMFLNSGQHLSILAELGDHALATYETLMRGRWDGLGDSIARSWELNQRLDAGTNPPAVQAILDSIRDQLAAVKLLGAGGGGYMLLLADGPEAATRIRSTLEQSPPNARARFVEFALSDTGLEITRS